MPLGPFLSVFFRFGKIGAFGGAGGAGLSSHGAAKSVDAVNTMLSHPKEKVRAAGAGGQHFFSWDSPGSVSILEYGRHLLLNFWVGVGWVEDGTVQKRTISQVMWLRLSSALVFLWS